MIAENLLARLKRVKYVGPGRWVASCPTTAHQHGDRSRGLSISAKQDGGLLIYCHAGCGAADIVGAVDLDLSDLFPSRADPLMPSKPLSTPFIPAQVFEIARREIGIAAIICGDVLRTRTISEVDYIRFRQAVERLERIAEAAYGS